MVYWINGNIGSSVRYYYEFFHGKNQAVFWLRDKEIKVPTAVAIFPRELFTSPRAWVEYVYVNIIRWTRFEHGGHFALLEQTEVLVKDLRAFKNSLALQDSHRRASNEL